MPDIQQTPDYVADCERKNSELFKQWAHNGHTAHTRLHHNQSGLDKCHKQFPLQLAKGCEVHASLGQMTSASASEATSKPIIYPYMAYPE